MTDQIRLWPEGAPGSESWTHSEVAWRDEATGDVQVCNVSDPTITPFFPNPAAANGAAIIVAPGGGFFFLSEDNEGVKVAEWLTTLGFTAFVLHYRLRYTGATNQEFREFSANWLRELIAAEDKAVRSGNDVAPDVAPLSFADGEQAVRVVRSRAAEWSIDPDKVGFMGFSAGAFVTTAVALTADPAARPNFVAPIYGGRAESPVPETAPPLFSAVATDDLLCVDTTIATFEAWRAARRPAELHSYAEGGHGFGMSTKNLPVDSWRERFAEWLRSLGY